MKPSIKHILQKNHRANLVLSNRCRYLFVALMILNALSTLATGLAQSRVHSVPPTKAETSPGKPESSNGAKEDMNGANDFDFLVGEWRVHHRVKRPVDSQEWSEFDGTCSNRTLMDGSANVESHTFNRSSGVTYGIALRAYDPKTAQWAIWWVDSRDPSLALDPPMKGRFDNGVGTFYSDGMVNGKPTRTRFIWSRITPTAARWEQAFSHDEGKTWDTNWIMDFTRIP
jgi:hypothetical protein